MSFLIDDILKKSPVKFKNSTRLDYIKNETSILEKTLLNRNPHQYYSENIRLYSSESNNIWCNDEKKRGIHNYQIYGIRALSYPPHVYMKNYIWPSQILSHFCNFTKRKGGQIRFTAKQTDVLEKRFSSHKYLSPEDRKLLADSLKLTDRQVKTWFQNRRAKWRRNNSTSLQNPEGYSCEKYNNNKGKEMKESYKKL